mmetsp:Transcript_164/g.497  ORF Transcript_164/g.497 Transcript_164/m.497 type:complete len:242 (+) Transcript_164:867-1592(+)
MAAFTPTVTTLCLPRVPLYNAGCLTPYASSVEPVQKSAPTSSTCFFQNAFTFRLFVVDSCTATHFDFPSSFGFRKHTLLSSSPSSPSSSSSSSDTFALDASHRFLNSSRSIFFLENVFFVSFGTTMRFPRCSRAGKKNASLPTASSLCASTAARTQKTRGWSFARKNRRPQHAHRRRKKQRTTRHFARNRSVMRFYAVSVVFASSSSFLCFTSSRHFPEDFLEKRYSVAAALVKRKQPKTL